MLIEDDVDHAELMRRAIETEFEVYWTKSGRDALKYLKGLSAEARPVVILVDYGLPGLDGLGVLRHILDEAYDIPVIMVTGQGDELIAVKAMKEGAYDYVVKSVDYFAVLLSVIHKTLQQHNERKEKARLEDELKKLSVTDDLTGLFNRRYFRARLEEETIRAKRQRCSVSLLLIDLDNFKRYNDAHGHVEGDWALKKVAEIILRNIRKKVDTGCRQGGDEFAVIMPGANKAQACGSAERIKKAVKEAEIGRITASVGVAEYGNESIEDFIEIVDEILYKEKTKKHL
ncbi:MAG: hypothetical protein BA861_03660 [Desulfobacterales bacterium S3730MH5]|nr:MAG: hypothetical protein BA861_03660 [Desulfobacterales bacterium S3730MH5]